MQMYTQCKIVRKTNEGLCEDIAFIPIEFARIGRNIRIKKDNEWIDGWTVSEVYKSSTVTETVALKAQNEYRDYGTEEIAGRTSRKDL